MILRRSRDYDCPALHSHVEYMIWRDWDGRPTGAIPAPCMEAIGIDTSPLDSGGTIWFNLSRGRRMRRHRHFKTAEEWRRIEEDEAMTLRPGRGGEPGGRRS